MFTARHREAVTRERGTSSHTRRGGMRSRSYVLYGSYVLLGWTQIQPISEQIPDQAPLAKAQRSNGEAYESPALPLSYSAADVKNIERHQERQTPAVAS